MRRFGVSSRAIGVRPDDMNATSSCVPHRANSSPHTPPTVARTMLSTSSCLIKRRRAAPSASRIANSERRIAALARSRLAVFAHAISKTTPTIASSTKSGREN
jgi:hypothetical protein